MYYSKSYSQEHSQIWLNIALSFISVTLILIENKPTNQDVHVNSTEWFKINLTLFKNHISHKWGNIMNLFEDFHKM